MKLSLMAGHISRVIFRAYQQKYNREWDKKLNVILGECQFLSLDEYNVNYKYKGNTYSIWISNQWYSYAHLNRFNDESVKGCIQFRPSFSTMIRLHRVVNSIQSLGLQSDFRRIYLDEDKL